MEIYVEFSEVIKVHSNTRLTDLELVLEETMKNSSKALNSIACVSSGTAIFISFDANLLS